MKGGDFSCCSLNLDRFSCAQEGRWLLVLMRWFYAQRQPASKSMIKPWQLRFPYGEVLFMEGIRLCCCEGGNRLLTVAKGWGPWTYCQLFAP